MRLIVRPNRRGAQSRPGAARWRSGGRLTPTFHHSGHGHLGGPLGGVDAHHTELLVLGRGSLRNRARFGRLVEHDIEAGCRSRSRKEPINSTARRYFAAGRTFCIFNLQHRGPGCAGGISRHRLRIEGPYLFGPEQSEASDGQCRFPIPSVYGGGAQRVDSRRAAMRRIERTRPEGKTRRGLWPILGKGAQRTAFPINVWNGLCRRSEQNFHGSFGRPPIASR